MQWDSYFVMYIYYLLLFTGCSFKKMREIKYALFQPSIIYYNKHHEVNIVTIYQDKKSLGINEQY